MARRHLDAETLHRLAARDLQRDELQAAGWHLYKCRRCRGRVRQALADGDRILERLFAGIRPVDVHARKDYRSAFGNALRSVADHVAARRGEAGRSAAWLDDVLRLPAEERADALERHPEHATWSLAEGLLDACRRDWSDRPAASAELARLALLVIAHLRGDAGADGARGPLLSDLEARAWAYVGNCCRIRSDLRGGAEAFTRALAALERGSGDDAERARVLDLHASLLRAQRRLDESERTLEQAIRLYTAVDDRPGVARALIKQAMTVGYAGQTERAIELDRRALAMIDEPSQPRLAMSATTNLVQDLQVAGRLEEALALVPEARRLKLAHGSGTDLRRLRWTEGVLARDTGDLETAERLLLEVRGELVEDGNAYDAALVSLELAVLYVEQGRTAETRRLAEEMLPIFQSHDIGREAMASLMLFQQAALAERLTAGLAREVAQAMRHGRSAGSATPPPAPS